MNLKYYKVNLAIFAVFAFFLTKAQNSSLQISPIFKEALSKNSTPLFS